MGARRAHAALCKKGVPFCSLSLFTACVRILVMLSGGVDRVLQLKTQRLQVQGRLDEWEQQFTRIHSRDASDADRQHSKQHRELRRLLDDIDALIDSLAGGSGALDRDSNAPRDIEKRAERGRIKCAGCRYAPVCHERELPVF